MLDCEDVDLLIASSISGSLDDEGTSTLFSHLEQCLSCRTVFCSMSLTFPVESTFASMGDTSDVEHYGVTPVEVHEPSAPRRGLRYLLAMAAAVFISGILGGYLLSQRTAYREKDALAQMLIEVRSERDAALEKLHRAASGQLNPELVRLQNERNRALEALQETRNSKDAMETLLRAQIAKLQSQLPDRKRLKRKKPTRCKPGTTTLEFFSKKEADIFCKAPTEEAYVGVERKTLLWSIEVNDKLATCMCSLKEAPDIGEGPVN